MPANTSHSAPVYREGGQLSTSDEEDETPPMHPLKVTSVIDDGTKSFFWGAHSITVLVCMLQGVFLYVVGKKRAHSVTVLVCMLGVFLYVALIEDTVNDTNYNAKRGILACIVVFCLWGMTQAKDGPFTRPHPAFWRLVLCLSVVYELALVYVLFQSRDDTRQLLTHFDPKLGKVLPEQSYAEDCRIYDPSPHPDGHFHNFWEKCDVFIWGHLLGWYAKMLIVRDYWLCNVISILFEVLEYSLEHQLPNFAECWWDHWILDALVCNGLGIWLGMKTLNWLNAHTYHWRGLWSIPTYSGKLKRMVMQFTPYSWTEYEWHPTESLSRWIYVILLVSIFLLAELNCFYLKFVLWIPPPHFLNVARLIFLFPVGAVTVRESYQYLNDPNCHKLGQQAWVAIAMVFTEFLIVVKFDLPLLLLLPPIEVVLFWAVFSTIIIAWTLYYFFLRPYQKYKRKQMLRGRQLRKGRASSPSRHHTGVTSQTTTNGVEFDSKGDITNGQYRARLRTRSPNVH